ncbi:MAG TPA: hypothetical protein VFJ71_07540 [Candidatus Limnocylindrales bacterium]|nr:hypothetical protein [Candidatus Limnocylindrales bacterium]
MSHDGLPARARIGAREAAADRRTGLAAIAGLTMTLAVAACGGTSSSGNVAGASGTPLASVGTGASASAEASASAGGSGLAQGFLTFQELNASKVFGGGTITDLGDGTVAVTLGVVAVGYADPLPARLVSGSCADAASAPAPSYAPPPPSPSAEASGAGASAPASVAPSVAASPSAAESGSPAPATLPVELTPVALGGSNTVVQIDLQTLLSSPSSVLIYKSQADPQLVACSDVTPTLVIPSGAPSSAGSAAPSESPMASVAASGSTAP